MNLPHVPADPFQLVFDASTAGPALGLVLPFLFGLSVGVYFIRRGFRRRARGQAAIAIVWTCSWALLGGFGVGNVNYQRWKCSEWADSGDYSVAEGVVEDFRPRASKPHRESFTVQGVTFEYSDFDLSKGGFNNSAAMGGPIRAGLRVRVAHREGRILKLWVADSREEE